MSQRPMFYYNTIKNLTVAFATIFDDIQIINDNDDVLKIPLHYSPKEKFIPIIAERGDYSTGTNYFTTLPRMGFEMTGINYAPERMASPLSKIPADLGNGFLLTRIPYNLEFSLYIATKKQEEGLKIVEQILPIFLPEYNITINEMQGYNLNTDIPVVLTGTTSEVEYEGDYMTRRSWWLWTLTFTIKAWLYGNERHREIIKKTIIDLTPSTIQQKYETLMSEVVPFEANKTDPHIIVDTIINY